MDEAVDALMEYCEKFYCHSAQTAFRQPKIAMPTSIGKCKFQPALHPVLPTPGVAGARYTCRRLLPRHLVCDCQGVISLSPHCISAAQHCHAKIHG